MKQETAIFAGGCFWCMVKPFDQQPGIISVISGYTGGQVGTYLIRLMNKFARIQLVTQRRLKSPMMLMSLVMAN